MDMVVIDEEKNPIEHAFANLTSYECIKVDNKEDIKSVSALGWKV
jgi:hypothetical protein